MIQAVTADNFHLFQHSNFDPSLYRMLIKGIVGYTGHEMRSWDFDAATTYTTRILRMGLDERDERALCLIVNALALNAPRFNDDPHLPSRNGCSDRAGVGENSGSHVLHAAVLGTSRVMRAGLFAPDMYDQEVARLTLWIQRGALAHENGEIAGEPASVAQSLHNVDGKEDREYEPKITRFALELAYHLEETMRGNFAAASARFLAITAEIARKLDLQKRGLPSAEEFTKVVVEPHWQFNPSADTRLRASQWYKDYLRTEQPDLPQHTQAERFAGYVTKIAADRQQGNLYFIRASVKHPLLRRFCVDGESVETWPSAADKRSIPLVFVENARHLANFTYMFSKLGDMFASAETPKEWILARCVRNDTLRTGIEMLQVSNFILDLKSPEPDPAMEPLLRALSRGDLNEGGRQELIRLSREKQLALLALHRQQRIKNPSDDSCVDPVCRIETRLRLQAWLRYMIEKDYVFAPGESPIHNLAEIAAKLGPLPARLLHGIKQRTQVTPP